MSYDLDHVIHRCSCPCGRGEIVHGYGTNDWNQIKEDMTEINCPYCFDKYRFYKDGLLPKDYPVYEGDPAVKRCMDNLNKVMPYYSGFSHRKRMPYNCLGFSLLRQRIYKCLTDDELSDSNVLYFVDAVLGYSRDLADQYSLEDLNSILYDLKSDKFKIHNKLTRLSRKVYNRYKKKYIGCSFMEHITGARYYNDYPFDLTVFISLAIRNYDFYLSFAEDDAQLLEGLHVKYNILEREYAFLEQLYYKDSRKYEVEAEKYLIPFELHACV